jgi:hypothetical protein
MTDADKARKFFEAHAARLREFLKGHIDEDEGFVDEFLNDPEMRVSWADTDDLTDMVFCEVLQNYRDLQSGVISELLLATILKISRAKLRRQLCANGNPPQVRLCHRRLGYRLDDIFPLFVVGTRPSAH